MDRVVALVVAKVGMDKAVALLEPVDPEVVLVMEDGFALMAVPVGSK